MKNFRPRLFAILCVTVCSISLLRAQKTQNLEQPIQVYHHGVELFQKEKYAAARQAFAQFMEQSKDTALSIRAKFYDAICAFELYNPDALELFKALAYNYPQHPCGVLSYFQIGRIHFRDKKYKLVAPALALTDHTGMIPDDEKEYWFIKGFSYYKLNQYEEAKEALAQVCLDENKYYKQANYYKGFIHYQRNEYDLAEQALLRVLDHKQFGQVAPLYITQIYFKQGKFQQVVDISDTMTNKEILDDINHINGLSQYRLGNFEKAETRLEKAAMKGKITTDSDVYALAWSNQQLRHYEKAINRYSRLVDRKNGFSQNVGYNLAYCMLQLNKRENARLAFYQASRADFDLGIKEEASFQYAKLCYELLPQQAVAITSLSQFITHFPNSKYNEDAKDLLSVLFLNTKQFTKALEILEPLKNKNSRVKQAIQKSAYCKAEELYQAGDISGAEKLFRKSLEYPEDKKFTVLADYWLAEMMYKRGRPDEALELYEDFLEEDGAKKSVHYATCYYNIGYCMIKKEQWSKAVKAFTKFTELESFYNDKPDMVLDAHTRLADCYFIQKQYNSALAEYNWVVVKDARFHDYALFQKGIIYGLMGKQYEKINMLAKLVEMYDESDYLEKSLYELGYTNFYLDKLEEALDWFDQLVTKKKNGNDVRRAQLNIGLIFKRQNKAERAIEQFQYVMSKYPESEEAKEAYEILKDLYVEKGDIESLNILTKGKLNLSEQDSIIYESSQNALRATDTALAIKGLDSYLSQFSNGFFSTKAHYQRAEIFFRKKKYTEALPDYEWLASKPQHEYTDRSVKNCASLFYQHKEYTQALRYFEQYEPLASTKENVQFSLLGQMRCSEKLNNSEKLRVSAQKLIGSQEVGVEQKLEAQYLLAKSYYPSEPDKSKIYFKEVTKGPKNWKSAESKYMLAQIQYEQWDTLGCKKSLKELASQYGDFEYWVAKGFILLANNYVHMSDTFQARHTLQSVIENYEPDTDDPEDIVKTAKEKLEALMPPNQSLAPPEQLKEEEE
ncbi:MAG: tetratricopeptide repeat protein [Flavobacteriaceae bacterium]|nr:tetratricopeptide repeat protein [Flavobacteriaceae bacterium]